MAHSRQGEHKNSYGKTSNQNKPIGFADPGLMQALEYEKNKGRGVIDPGLLQAQQARDKLLSSPYLSLKGPGLIVVKPTPTQTPSASPAFADPGLLQAEEYEKNKGRGVIDPGLAQAMEYEKNKGGGVIDLGLTQAMEYEKNKGKDVIDLGLAQAMEYEKNKGRGVIDPGFAQAMEYEKNKGRGVIDLGLAQAMEYKKNESETNGFADSGLLQAQRAQEMIKFAPYLHLKGQQPTELRLTREPIEFADIALDEARQYENKMYSDYRQQQLDAFMRGIYPVGDSGVHGDQAGLDKLDRDIQTLTEYSNTLKQQVMDMPSSYEEMYGVGTNPDREKLKAEITKTDADIVRKKASAVELQKYLDMLAAEKAMKPKIDVNALAMPFPQTASQQSIDDLEENLTNLRTERDFLKDTMGEYPELEKVQRYNTVITMINQKEKALELQQTEYFYKHQSDAKNKLETVMNDIHFANVYTSLDGSEITETKGIKGVVKYLTDETYRSNTDKQLMDKAGSFTSSIVGQTGATIKMTENAWLNYMTLDEKHVIEYYAAKGDWVSAQKYYDTIKRDLQARYQTAVSQWTQDYSNEHKGVGVIMNVAGNLSSPAAFGATLWENLKNTFSGNFEPLNTNTIAFSGAHMEQDSKKGITRDLYGMDKQLAETGLALANYLATAPFGPEISLYISASSAAGNTALEAAQRGATTSEMLQLSTTAGVIDYLAGKIEVDDLLEITKGGKNALLYYLEDIGTEVGINDIKTLIKYYGNTLSDNYITGSKSRYNQTIEVYKAKGCSNEEAVRKAFQQIYITDPLSKLFDSTIVGTADYIKHQFS